MSNILVAVDDEYFGNLLADFAAEHFASPGTNLRVLTVIPWLPPETQVRGSKDLQAFVEATRNSRRVLLQNCAEHLKSMLRSPASNIDLDTLEGNAAEQILKVAESWPADLILVGSHSRKGLNLFIMGSVSLAIVNHAPCSVLVIRPQKSAEIRS